MPTTPYAVAQISVNGGAPQQGGLTVAGASTIQLSLTNTSLLTSVRWEIYAYPSGWPTPSGWTLDASTGIIYSTDTTPTLITLEAAATRWGKWLVRCIGNGGTKNGVPPTTDPVTGSYLPNDVIDIASGWEVVDPVLGLHEPALYESTQFGGLRRWVDSVQKSLRSIAGSGALIGTASGPGASSASSSLAVPSLAHPDWARVASSLAPVVQAQHNEDNAPYADSCALNPYGDAPASAYLAWRVVAPPGCTTLTLALSAKQYSGASTLALAIYATDNTTQLGVATAALTASYATYSVSHAATPGAEYIIRVVCNDTGIGSTAQASAEVGSLAVTFDKSTDPVLKSSFTRLHVEPRTLVDNVQTMTDVDDRGYHQSAGSGFVFETSATSVTVEAVSSIFTAHPDQSRIGVFVNGRAVAKIDPTNNGSLFFANVDLSSFSGNKRVELRTGAIMTDTGGDLAEGSHYNGTVLRAVYLPASVPARHITETHQECIGIIGDSISSGFKATDAATRGWPALLRQRFPGRVFNAAYGSQTLHDEYVRDPTFATFVRRLAQSRPTKLYEMGGHNDQSYGLWANAAAYGTALATFYDMVHTMMPWCQILAAPPILDAGEGTQAAQALCDYRTQKVSVAASRTAFCKLMRSAGYVSSSGLDVDNTHPNDRGADEIVRGILGDLGIIPTQSLPWAPNRTWASGAAIVEAWEADQTNITLNGFGIQNWPGLYNSHALAQATAADQPLLVSGLGPQGQSVCKFYGGGAPNNAMFLAGTFALSGPCSIYHVVYPNQAIGALGSNDSLFDGYNSQTAWLTNSTDFHLLISSGASNPQASFDAAQGKWQVITSQINGASTAIATTDGFQRTGGLNVAVTPNLGGFVMGNESLGGGTASTRSQAAYVLATYIFSGVHTETERNQFIEGYIRAKWGF